MPRLLSLNMIFKPSSDEFPEQLSCINPIVLTTLGRTGSNYTVALLGSHPSIVVYEPHRFEARYASYWTQIFLNLSNPNSYLAPLSTAPATGIDFIGDPKWMFGCRLQKDSGKLRILSGRPLMNSYYRNLVDEFRIFFLQKIQAFYRQVALCQNKSNVCFFCEKFLPDQFTEKFISIIHSSVELFLVRDFRDMVCSIFAFNQKRGTVRFGRENYSSDKEYIIHHVGPAVEALRLRWEKRNNTAFLIRYEDLILNTNEELKKIFQFIGIDNNQKTIEDVIYSASNTMPNAQKAHKTTASQQKSVGRYRKDMTQTLKVLCDKVFFDALQTFGYKI